MERFNSPSSFDQLSLFFKLWELLLTGDVPKSFEIDNILKQLTFSEKQIARRFFELIIDQPAFMSEDHKRLRALFLDWYAAHRTMITRADNVGDPFSLADEALSELIKSFGFPYPNLIITGRNKVLFLLDLVNLYNKKGTPEVLARALQYFGLQNIRLSEWWVHRRMPEDDFVARSQIIIPRLLRNSPVQELAYDEFIATDPHWRLAPADLRREYDSSLITLPSLTPHISIDAAIPISTLYPVYAILCKKLQESFDHWSAGGGLYQDIIVERYGMTISFLELMLAITYLFSSISTASGSLFYQYQEMLDINDDGIDDVDYQVIIDEYNNINTRPTTRAQRDSKLTQLKEKFSGQTSGFFYNDPSDAETYLGLVNSDLKDMIDDDIYSLRRELALESLFFTLDGYIQQDLDLTNVSLSHLIYGSSTYERLKPIINFFKPYRVRIRELLTSFAIEEPVQHSMLAADYLALSWRWIIENRVDDTNPAHDTITNILGVNHIHADSYRILDSMPKEECFTQIGMEFDDCLIADSTSDFQIWDSTADYSMNDELDIEVWDSTSIYGLFGFWPLDEESLVASRTLRDRSGSGNHGTAFEDPLFCTGEQFDVNGATIFDATSTIYIDLGSALLDTVDGLQPYTCTAWIKPTLGCSTAEVITQDGGGLYGFKFGLSGHELTYWKDIPGPNLDIESTEKIDDDSWRFISFVKDSTGNVTLYIDAIEDGSGSDTDPFENTNTEIGDSFDAEDTYSGCIENVRIYDRLLTQEELEQIYDFEKYEHLFDFWPLSEWSLQLDGTLRDTCGDNNCDIGDSPATFVDNQKGESNGAIRFDGVNDYLGGSLQLAADYPFSLAVWIKTTGTENQLIFGLQDNTVDDISYDLWLKSNGDICAVSENTGGSSLATSSTAVNDDVWHFIVGTFTVDGLRSIYVDGVWEDDSGGERDYIPTVNSWSIGRWDSPIPNNYFTGDLCNARFYNKALTEVEVKEIYDSEKL